MLDLLIRPRTWLVLTSRSTPQDIAAVQHRLEQEDRAAPAFLRLGQPFAYELGQGRQGIAITPKVTPRSRRSILIQNGLDLAISAACLLMIAIGAGDENALPVLGNGALLFPAGCLVTALVILCGSWITAASLRRRVKRHLDD